MSMSGRADEHRWARWASEGHQRSLMSIAGAVVGCGGGETLMPLQVCRGLQKYSRDAFVSARGLVKAVREGMGETQTPQTNLRNERGRGFGLMLIDPKRRGCTAKAQLMLETLI